MLAALGLFPKEANQGSGTSSWTFPPQGASVNDGIDPEEFTLHYITVDQVIRLVCKLGPGALMAKFDVEAAYRNVPVHPSHRVLLGMK